jgi:hypothetical protein
MRTSGSLSDFAGLNASGADFLAANAALRQMHPNGLQVGIENAWRPVVGVRYIIAKLRAFATNFTTLCHDC